MVGSTIYRLLKSHGYTQLITRSSKELDLRNQHVVNVLKNTLFQSPIERAYF